MRTREICNPPLLKRPIVVVERLNLILLALNRRGGRRGSETIEFAENLDQSLVGMIVDSTIGTIRDKSFCFVRERFRSVIKKKTDLR